MHLSLMWLSIPKDLQDSICYLQFLRLIRIHSESYYLIKAEIEIYFHFLVWAIQIVP